MLTRSLLALAVAALPALGQATPAAPSPMADARALWMQVRAYVTESANDVPESLYSYKPTPEVRTFAQLIAHIAGSQSQFCAIALGEKHLEEDAVEKGPLTKAVLVAALDASNKYCARAYQLDDKAAAVMVDLFGQQHSRLYALLQNATHDNEHYGNIVTYMRLNNMVPPSSKQR